MTTMCVQPFQRILGLILPCLNQLSSQKIDKHRFSGRQQSSPTSIGGELRTGGADCAQRPWVIPSTCRLKSCQFQQQKFLRGNCGGTADCDSLHTDMAASRSNTLTEPGFSYRTPPGSTTPPVKLGAPGAILQQRNPKQTPPRLTFYRYYGTGYLSQRKLSDFVRYTASPPRASPKAYIYIDVYLRQSFVSAGFCRQSNSIKWSPASSVREVPLNVPIPPYHVDSARRLDTHNVHHQMRALT